MKSVRLLRDIQLGVRNLLLHKLRSLLTVLGVVFRVMMPFFRAVSGSSG